MADRYWVGGNGTWDTTSTANWSTTSGGASGASVPTAADNVFFDQASTYTVTMTGAIRCLDLTVSAGTVTFSTGTSPTLQISGNFSLVAGTVWSSTSLVAFTATTSKTITSNGVSLACALDFLGIGGTWTLQSALTLTNYVQLSAGTLSLGVYTLTTTLFTTSSTFARTLAFGTGAVTISPGAGTVYSTSNETNYSVSGSRTVNVAMTNSCGISTSTTPSEAKAVDFYVSGGTAAMTFSVPANNYVRTIDLSGSACVFNANGGFASYGSFLCSTTTSFLGGNLPLQFYATSGSWVISPNGRSFGGGTVGFYAAGATWTLQGAMTCANITLTAGSFDTAGYAISIAPTGSGAFQSTSSNVRSLSLGASTISFGASAGFNVSPTTNLTFNAGTSLLTFAGASPQFNTPIVGGLTFYNVSFTSTAITTLTIAGPNTYNNFSIAGKASAGTSTVSIAANQTINGTLTISAGANEACRTFFASNTIGTQRTLSVAALGAGSGTVDFRDIAVTGAAAPIAPTSAGNAGNNSGITFPVAKTVYWNLSGTQAWTAVGWAATSGGVPAAANYPLPQDTAVFDNTGAAGTVQITTAISVGTLDMSARAVGVTLSISSATLSVYGDLKLGSGVTLTLSSAVFALTGPNNHALTSAGKLFNNATNINILGGGTTTLQDTFNAFGSSVTLISGTLNINSQTASASNFNINSPTNTAAIANGTFTCGGGTISAGTLAVGTGYNINCTSVYTLTAGTITINDGVSLPIAYFNSTGTGTRVINFGTGQFTISGNSSIIWNLAGSNISLTGTFKVVTTDSSNNAKTIVNPSVAGLQQDVSTSGSSGYIISGASNYRVVLQGWYNNIDVSGMAVGSTFDIGSGVSLYGNLTLGGRGTTTTNFGTLTFAGTSGVKTVNTGGSTLNFPVTFDGVGSTWQLQSATTVSTSQMTRLYGGTLDLNGYTYTTGQFDASLAATRAIAFGTGNITLTGSGSVWTLAPTSFSRTGTPTVNVSNNSAAATTVTTGSVSEAQALDFNYTTGTYTLTDTSAIYRSVNLTGFSGIFPNSVRSYYGGLNVGSTATLTAGGSVQTFVATSGTWGITPNGRTTDFPFTFNGVGGTWQLQGALTASATRTATLTAGTLDLNGYTYTTGLFNSSGSGVRAIAFGTGNITLTGTGTVWTTLTTTNFSRTGTPTVNVSNNSATATTVSTGTLTEAKALDFNYTTGTYVLTDTAAVYRNINLTGFAGTFQNVARTYYGGFNAGSTATMTGGTAQQSFAATSGTWNIICNGRTLDFQISFIGAGGGTWQLQDALTAGSTRGFDLNAGTLDINGKSATVGTLNMSGTQPRAIANGILNCVAVSHTAGAFAVGGTYNISTTGTYTFTAGTLTINDGATLPVGAFSSSGSSVRSIAFGTGQISLSGNAATIWDTTTATNFSFTGTFKVVATYTGATGTRTLNQGGTEATVQSISTTGSSGFILDTSSTDIKALAGSWGTIDLTGVTGTLANGARFVYGGFNAGSTVTLAAGTNVTTFASTTGVQTITMNGRTVDFPLTFQGIGGTWQLQDAASVGSTRTTALNNGTLDLNGFTFTTGLFNTATTSARTIAFGSGNITLTGSGSVWAASPTNFSRTGTPTVNVANNSATATTVTGTGMVESQALDFNYTVGTYALTDTNMVYRSLNLTGFAGTFPNNARTYYGGFNAGSTATMTGGATAQTFAATSGTWSITPNGRTLDFPLTFSGVGGTWQLQGALTIGATRTFTLTSGTFDANNYNVTTGSVVSSNSTVRTLALGSGTWTVSGTGTPWNFSTSTNATITGTATISMTGATAKTFAGGSLTWPTLNQGGAGALTISGNNTFANITSTYTATAACTITFPNAGTQTLTSLTAGGTVGKLLTLNSSTAGTRANLVVNNNVNLSYTSLRDNSVSGGYVYNARYVNGNVNAGNNLGWEFGPIPGSFFAFF